MRRDVIDDFDQSEISNYRQYKKIILVIFISLILLVFGELLDSSFLENLVGWKIPQINIKGLNLLLVILYMSLSLSNILNKIEPRLKKVRILVYTGLIIFISELLFKLIQNVFLFNAGWDLDYLSILKLAITLGIAGSLIANIRINKLRKENIVKPIFLFIGFWLILNFLYNKI